MDADVDATFGPDHRMEMDIRTQTERAVCNWKCFSALSCVARLCIVHGSWKELSTFRVFPSAFVLPKLHPKRLAIDLDALASLF